MKWAWWRRQPASEPVDEGVETVPLEREDGDVVRIRQEPGGPESLVGQGEWPDQYDAEPAAPAPGVDDDDRARIEEERRERAARGGADRGLKGAIEADDDRRLGRA